MVLTGGSPFRIAAIDAGSNAIRLAIAEARSAVDVRLLDRERSPVRLGHRVFLEQQFDAATISRAARAFRHFRELLDRYKVTRYRAVATSATREARNRHLLLHRIRQETGLKLRVIHAAEEALLVRRAVLGSLHGSLEPRLIFDLGGGSLELTLLRGETVERTVDAPLGTVRLMETANIRGAISEEQYGLLHYHILSELRTRWPSPPDLSRAVVVGCGGNAEALARLAPGAPLRGIPVLNFVLLKKHFDKLLQLDVQGRMKAFRLRQDRADVIAIAAVVFTTLGEWLGLRRVLVPGVGVREGILEGLAAALFPARPSRAVSRREMRLLESARGFAARMRSDRRHCENTRRTAASIFDQLTPLHGLSSRLRLPLEMAAILHDVGRVVSEAGHQKHGEYLVRHGEIPGLTSPLRELVACLIRYHGKTQPEPHHKIYSSFSAAERRQIRILAALLRIAVALQSGSRHSVGQVDVSFDSDEVTFRVHAGAPIDQILRLARRRADLLEREFTLRARFLQADRRQGRETTKRGGNAARSARSPSRTPARQGKRKRSKALASAA
jgi:exopolyphosphatase/guanosine-5'-triphosphate,3'-diphosphate pyrophosphatase